MLSNGSESRRQSLEIKGIHAATAGARGSVGIMIFDAATGKPALMLEQSIRRSFSFISGGSVIDWTQKQDGSFFLRLARNEIDKTWTASARINADDDWHIIATVTDGTFEGPVVVEQKLALYARTPVGTIDAQFLSVEFIHEAQRPTYTPLIGLDLAEAMTDVSSSAYIRYPFRIDGDPNRFDVLSLGTRFDDAFKAYLNGVEITSHNGPIVSSWNSAAAGVHGAVHGQIPLEQFDVSNSRGLLRSGENILAIHAMNVSVDDSDFFFQGGLVASELTALEERIFASPTRVISRRRLERGRII